MGVRDLVRQTTSNSAIDHVGVEMKKQGAIAIPMIVTNAISYAIIVASLMFVGHLGELELSGASLGNSLASVSGFTVMIGLGSGLETLCGQAFGSKQFHLLGIYFQASALALTAIAIPISALWWNLETILVWAGQDAEIAYMSGLYVRTLIPALFAAAITQPLIKLLQTQSVVLPIMVCSVTTMVVHVPLSYYLVFRAPYGGFRGGALAVDISYWFLLLQLALYVAFSRREERTWNGFSLPTLDVLKLYLRLAIPSACMICFQYWAFEILTILSGLMPNPQREVSLLSICLNTAGMAFTLPFGLSAAASTRISNEIGAANGPGARLAMRVVVGLAAVQSAIVASLLLLLRSSWGLAFSSESEVVDSTTAIMPYLALGTFVDGIQGVLQGVMRGCGQQDVGTIINLVAFYGVGVPLALLFGFKIQLHGKGLYIGCLCGLMTQMICMVVITFQTDWTEMVESARRRLYTSAGEEEVVKVEGEWAGADTPGLGDLQKPLLLA